MNRFYSTSFRILLGFCSGWVLCLPVMAAPPAPVFDPAVLEARDQEAKALKNEGKEIRANADQQLEVDTWNCYSKILVNRCIDQARDRRYQEREKARFVMMCHRLQSKFLGLASGFDPSLAELVRTIS